MAVQSASAEPMTVEQARRVEPVTAAEVEQAEAEAAEAARLVGALKERVRQGDADIGPGQIEAQRDLANFAELRAQAAARRFKRWRQAERLLACEALREEMETYAEGAGQAAAVHLKAAEEALNAFLSVVEERNAKIKDWRRRIQGLKVPRHVNPLVPPAEHAHLGYGDHDEEVIAGRRRMKRLDADGYVARMLVRVREANRRHDRLTFDMKKIANAKDPYADLRQVDAPPPEPDPNLRFFLTKGGAVLPLGHEPSAAEWQGLQREISRKEAWGA